MEKFHEVMKVKVDGNVYTERVRSWSGHGEQRDYEVSTRSDLVLCYDFIEDEEYPWCFNKVDSRGRMLTCFPNAFKTWYDAIEAMVRKEDLFWK